MFSLSQQPPFNFRQEATRMAIHLEKGYQTKLAENRRAQQKSLGSTNQVLVPKPSRGQLKAQRALANRGAALSATQLCNSADRSVRFHALRAEHKRLERQRKQMYYH